MSDFSIATLPHPKGFTAAFRVSMILLLTSIVCLGGAWQAWTAIVSTDAPGVRAVIVGQQVESRAGLITVTGVETINGLTNDDLGGMSHGITGLVDAEHMMVRVTVLLRAPASAASGLIGPRDFAIRRSTGELVPPVGGSLQSNRLEAGEQLEGSLGFVLPREDSALVLEMVDGLTPPVSVDLGEVDAAPPRAPATQIDPHSH